MRTKKTILSNNSGDPQAQAMFDGVMATTEALRAIGINLNLNVADSLVCALGAVAYVAEQYDMRDAVADTLEEWVKALRNKSHPISFRQGDAGHA